MSRKLHAGIVLYLAFSSLLAAQVPLLISHQGRIAVDGANFDGTGQFRFAFVNSTGSVTYWSNDGTSVAGSEPAAAVAIPVTKGHYSVDLGDTSHPNMAALPDSLFDQGLLHLRVWFDAGAGSEQLSPDRRIAATPFARLARRVMPGSITSDNLAPGAVDSSHIAPQSIFGFQIQNGTITQSLLAPNAVLDTKIADNAIKARHLSTGIVSGSNLSADSVSTVHLGDSVVQTSKIVNQAVTTDKISNLSVTSIKLATNAVTGDKIPSGAITNSKLASNAVTGSKIANSTIQPADLGLNNFNTTFWRTGGNTGTTAGNHFLGTTDSQPLEFRSTNFRILRLESANVIGGSQFNQVTGGSRGATVFGGRNGAGSSDDNIASSDLATISGGAENRVSAVGGTVAGGINNSVGGSYGFVAGGQFNKANADTSFAGGKFAEARHAGSFVWSAGSSPYPSLAVASVSFYAPGGFGVDWFGQAPNGRGNRWIFMGESGGNSIETWTGGRLTNGGTWANSSDVNRKTAFADVDPAAVLEKVAKLPIRQWRYQVESEDVTHLGPTAQDFRAAFSLGDDDKSIATVDADGVALAAIQGLHLRLEAIRTENTSLKRENAEFRHRLALIERTLASLATTD